MLRSVGVLVLSIFFCCVASSLLPQTPYQTPNITNIPPTAAATCTGFKLFRRRPLYRDCNLAINGLSSNPIVGYFHAGGSMDLWQLPVTETIGTCEVALWMSMYSSTEPSSWQVLKKAARKLNNDCKAKAALGDVTGGVIGVGPHQRIQIAIRRNTEGATEGTDG